jgi:hypothetical protein
MIKKVLMVRPTDGPKLFEIASSIEGIAGNKFAVQARFVMETDFGTSYFSFNRDGSNGTSDIFLNASNWEALADLGTKISGCLGGLSGGELKVLANLGDEQIEVRIYSADIDAASICVPKDSCLPGSGPKKRQRDKGDQLAGIGWRNDAIGHLNSLKNHGLSDKQISHRAKYRTKAGVERNVKPSTIAAWRTHYATGGKKGNCPKRHMLDAILSVKPGPSTKFIPDQLTPLGKAINTYIEREKMLKKDFNALVGIEDSNFSKLVKGMWTPPEPGKLEEICKLVGYVEAARVGETADATV